MCSLLSCALLTKFACTQLVMRKTNIMLDSNLLPILFYTAGLAASGTKVFKNEFISRPFYTENIKSVAFHQKLKVLAHDHHEAVGQR